AQVPHARRCCRAASDQLPGRIRARPQRRTEGHPGRRQGAVAGRRKDAGAIHRGALCRGQPHDPGSKVQVSL
ncbi:DNA binding domain, excisionase family, partial [Arthrobacter sp. DR-2P]